MCALRHTHAQPTVLPRPLKLFCRHEDWYIAGTLVSFLKDKLLDLPVN